MKRTSLAPVALTIGLASTAWSALAQDAAPTLADFGPPAPAATMQSPELAPPPAPPASVDFSPPQPPPAAVETAPAAPELAAGPAESYDRALSTETRNAAPEAPPPARNRDAQAQTGPYLGRGLFNNWGPNDFGA